MADEMKVTFLDNGDIKVETDAVSDVNHLSAEGFFRFLTSAAGGTAERRHKHGILGAAAHALQHRFGLHHGH